MSWSALPTELQSQIIHASITSTLSSILTTLPPQVFSDNASWRFTLHGLSEREFGKAEWDALSLVDPLVDAEIEDKIQHYANTKIPVTPERELTKLTVVFPVFEDEIRARCFKEEKLRQTDAWCRTFWYSLLMSRYDGIYADGQVIVSFDCLSDKVNEWYEYRRETYWGCVNCPSCVRRQMEHLRGTTTVWEELRAARRWWCLSGKCKTEIVEVQKMEVGEDEYGHVLQSL